MFSTMTRISMASLRLTNPRFKITIVLDEISEELLRKSSDPLLMEVDEVMKIPTPNGNNVFRNRHIKTRLGTLIRGPFLFLDSDTIIRGDISAIFNFNGDVAGVPNLCQKTIEKQVWDQDLKTLKKMNWKTRNDYYINGGVLFCNPTRSTISFYNSWHSKWLQSNEKLKLYRDQPALNSAIYDSNIRLNILPNIYNAQFRGNPSVANNAKIWHYYTSAQKRVPVTSFEILCLQLMENIENTLDNVASIINSFHPWRREKIYDDWIAIYAQRIYQPTEFLVNWFSGNRIIALVRLLRNLIMG